MVLVLFANTNFKMYLLRVLSLIQELRFNVSVSMSGSGAMGLGVGSYQPGVYVPLKAFFLVSFIIAPAYSRVRYRSPNFCPSVRPSVRAFVRSSVRPSTFTSKFGFLDIRDSCKSETLHSKCP